LDLNFGRRLLKCYIWSIVFQGAETWTLRTVEYEDLESFEMWCWRRTGTVNWADHVKIEVLYRAKMEMNALNTVKLRKANWYSFKYNQQDATLYSILYYCQCSTCLRRFLRQSSGAQNCTHSTWYMSSLLAATASSSSKQTRHVPDVVCTVLSS
jgi:hypothetical protein